MRLDVNKKIRDVAGEHIVIMQGKEATDMTRVVALNESAMYLYKQLFGREFVLDDVVRLMMDEYEVDETTARTDAAAWLQEMRNDGLLHD